MRKKIWVGLMLMVACFGLAGCGNEEETEKDNDKVEKVVLKEDKEAELSALVEELTPVDYLGKSFNVSELTNDELLVLGLYLYDPKSVENTKADSATFIGNNVSKYFGVTDLEYTDVTCLCDIAISAYDEEKDEYSWTTKYHYTKHIAEPYMEVVEAYQEGEDYVIEVYKVFPDEAQNVSKKELNYYATYTDAANEENVLFTITDEADFETALAEVTEEQKVTYTYTFKLVDDNYVLVSYKINE